MKKFNYIFAIFIMLCSTTFCFGYENQKGKIDMHGGNTDSLGSSKGFSNSFGLSNNLNKQKKTKDDKNFIKIEKIEKIKKEEKKINE